MASYPLTVFFDGACPICDREIALMRRLDRRGRCGPLITDVDVFQAMREAMERFSCLEASWLHEVPRYHRACMGNKALRSLRTPESTVEVPICR